MELCTYHHLTKWRTSWIEWMQDTLNHEPQADAALECVVTLRSRMPRDERREARTVILRFPERMRRRMFRDPAARAASAGVGREARRR